METIHVKFDDLTAMAFKCNNSGPGFNCSNFQDSSKDSNAIPLKEDLDNLFRPLYEEYYETRSPEVSDNSTTNTIDNEDTPSLSSIIVEDNEAPQIVSSSEEPVANEPTTLVSNDNVDELVQEDVAELDGNTFYNPFHTPVLEDAESSSTFQDPSNIHEMSTMEPKNLKEAMLDHNWIESMQDKLDQFKRLDVWKLVKRLVGRNIITVKWLWKKKTDAKNTVIRNKSCLVSKDPDFPNHVYHLKKALYGLKHAPRAWYDKLSSFLLDHHFTKRIVDLTLFTRRHGDDILLVQIYVDDIIFGSTNPVFSNTFAKLMKNNFEMSMMGEMKFFLGLQDFEFELIAYSDADHARCHDDCKSTSGGIQFSGDKLVSWSTKKQDCTSMFTAKAKYRICNNGQNKDKSEQNQAWEWTEREKSSPTVPLDLIGPACDVIVACLLIKSPRSHEGALTRKERVEEGHVARENFDS
ncbi:retrovirus-related pol polyprotein from transposon TNT 1-94 [Tanacetum coccineum]